MQNTIFYACFGVLFRCFLNKSGFKNTFIQVVKPKEFSYEMKKSGLEALASSMWCGI